MWLVLAAVGEAQVPAQAPQPHPAPAEPAVAWGAEVDVVSQYVWRGFPYSEGIAVWPAAWVGACGFTASFFFNYDGAWDPRWNEHDLTFTYERAVGRLTLAGSYVRYVSYVRTLAAGMAVRPHVSFVRIGDARGRRLLNPPGATAGVAIVVGR